MTEDRKLLDGPYCCYTCDPPEKDVYNDGEGNLYQDPWGNLEHVHPT